jgi:hypothetical protein
VRIVGGAGGGYEDVEEAKNVLMRDCSDDEDMELDGDPPTEGAWKLPWPSIIGAFGSSRAAPSGVDPEPGVNLCVGGSRCSWLSLGGEVDSGATFGRVKYGVCMGGGRLAEDVRSESVALTGVGE